MDRPHVAPSAATLPRGQFLIEPYLYDVIAAHANGFGSLTCVNYGLADRVTVGLIPTAGFNKVSNGPSSSGIGLADLTLQTQYRLMKFQIGSWIPTNSVAVSRQFASDTALTSIRTNPGICGRFFNRQNNDDVLGTLGYVSFRGGGAFNTNQ